MTKTWEPLGNGEAIEDGRDTSFWKTLNISKDPVSQGIQIYMIISGAHIKHPTLNSLLNTLPTILPQKKLGQFKSQNCDTIRFNGAVQTGDPSFYISIINLVCLSPKKASGGIERVELPVGSSLKHGSLCIKVGKWHSRWAGKE